MKKILILSAMILFIFIMASCQSNEGNNTKAGKKEAKQNVKIAGYFTTNEVNINDSIPILFVVKNDSTKTVKVTEGDFSLEPKDTDIDHWYGASMGEEPRFIEVEPHEEAAIIALYLVTDDGALETASAKDFNLHYYGDLENIQYPLTLSDDVPAKYEEMAAEWNAEPEPEDEDEVDMEDDFDSDGDESEIVNGFEVQQRFQVTGYQMENRGRGQVKVNIRVENLTDEERTFDANILKMYDSNQEYGLAPVSDSAFNPLLKVPPHGKVDYREYYLLINDYDTDTDDVMAGILGFHYIDDQIMEQVDVYGEYQEELPSDFSPE